MKPNTPAQTFAWVVVGAVLVGYLYLHFVAHTVIKFGPHFILR